MSGFALSIASLNYSSHSPPAYLLSTTCTTHFRIRTSPVPDDDMVSSGVHLKPMLQISSHISIPDSEIDIHAMRSQGAGGQHVNKVSSAVHLQFNIAASSLPPFYKEELRKLRDHRISDDGVITIKAQQHRSQDRNRADALERLLLLIQSVAVPRKKRKATKPTKGSQTRRIESKKKQGRLKALRGTIE
jgi:ribosome-associated protein